MNLFDFIIIGILQGFLEWLPISSQGSVFIILSNFFNITPKLALEYSVFLHLGTVLSAIIYFRKEIFKILNLKSIINLFNFKKKNLDYSTKNLRFLFFAFIFTVIVSLPIYLFLDKYLESLDLWFITLLIAILLIVTGFIQLKNKNKTKLHSNLSFKNALFLGLSQGLAVLPGISRSGITTSVLLFEKFNAENAFKYSFLLSIPTVLAAEIFIIFFKSFSFNYYILVSLFCSFIVGYFTINLIMKFVKKVNFSYICFILAGIYILIIFI